MINERCAFCNLDSAGRHESHCPVRPKDSPVRDSRMGWICPKCGRVNSPDKLTCDCHSGWYYPHPWYPYYPYPISPYTGSPYWY